MKRVYYYLFLLFFCACDSYLDIVPDNIATIDYAFRDRAGAESFLATCYYYMPNIGTPAGDPGIMGGDDSWSLVDAWANSKTGNYNCYNIKLNQNSNSPYANFWEGANQGRDLYQAIRDCNIFLENIDKVGPDLGVDEKARWISEVKFLKAYYHYYLWRAYGPIPLVKENMPVDAGIEEVKVYRDRFDDCVDYCVQLINEAVPDLPLVIFDINSELRRITQPIALAIKAEMLVTAASPLFNQNQRLSGMVDNRNVNLFETNMTKKEKWERARDACKNAIDTIELARQSGQIYELYDFSKSAFYPGYSGVSDTSKLVMTLRSVVTDKWNSEIIWGTTNTGYTSCSLPHFEGSHANLAATEPLIAPTMRMVELFYSNHGVPIGEDKFYDYENRFKTEAAPEDHRYYIKTDYTTAKINMYREPRFYANLGFDGGYWLGNGRKLDFDQTPADQTAWCTQMLKGKPSGNFMGLRYSVTGYAVKKGSHIETSVNSSGTSLTTTQSSFPIIRLADLYLLYAEALNECLDEPNEEVYEYVNKIRTRAGLEGVVESWRAYTDPTYSEKPSSQSGMRDIIRQERMIELAFEGKRFWDVRRWLLAETELNKPIRAWNIMGEVPEDYYNVITLHQLSFSEKEYLWPIRQGEMLKSTNLIQNPGWN
ncbi:MAG: RagB/SusD family nutrient uptake outer membrane protein [Bacteroidales bacterium]|nr:RagB/SusD family nutrient uptake outer membrane protein [Bacteroidales bacterium]